MKITRMSPYSFEENTLDIDITIEQYIKWQEGALIQDVMPDLTPDEREFLITGLAPGEYEDMFYVPEEIEED